jgi:hypothetical protein
LKEGQVAVVVWLSIGCLSCSCICRRPHGISVRLYPLLSLLREVACSLTSSAGLRWCGPCVLSGQHWEICRYVVLRSFLLLHTFLCLLCCALRSICVCQQTQSQCPWCTAYTGSTFGSPGSCSVLLLRVATLPSAGRTTITVADSKTWKTVRNFYFSSHIVRFIKSVMIYGAEGRLTWGEANSDFAGKTEVWHGL